MKLERYYEDLSVQHVGTKESRAYYMPLDENGRDTSLLLSGPSWLFRLYPSPEDADGSFINPESIPDGFAPISVPSCLESLGYVQKQYTNVNYPIPYDPPYVPADNPVGAYILDFSKEKAAGRRYYLYFEGVDSAYYVYLNGEAVGYSEVPHSPSEFDVTDKLRDGENRLSVLVLKYSDGTYLEDQDKFRWSGIFRDVYLLDRPEDHIEDYEITADMHGHVSISFRSLSGKPHIKAVLSDADGRVLFEGESDGEGLSFTVDDPHMWSAEDPYLYSLELSVPGERIRGKVGLRSVWIEGKTVLFNGRPVKFIGVNRHESNPYTGAAVTREDTLEDLKLMKAYNINTIRTSHYPSAPWFYEMCSEYGFYVVSESDVECHGVLYQAGGSHQWNYDTIARDPSFCSMILDRSMMNVEVNKNACCVFMWSLGNESGYGENFIESARWVKERDRTRLVHYEGATHSVLHGVPVDDRYLDVDSFMYPEVSFIDAYYPDPKHEKPSFLCEYMHSMGNGPGDIEDYIEVFRRHPEIMGGCAWEWCDHATYEGEDPAHGPRFHYGGDAGEFPHDGNFCLDGLVYPDRRPHTGLIEYGNVLRPVRARLSAVADGFATIIFRSWFSFRSLEGIEAVYEIKEHGAPVSSGSIALSAAAGSEEEHRIAVPKTGNGDVHVTISYRRTSDEPLVPASVPFGFDQLTISEGEERVTAIQASGSVSIHEDEKSYTVSGEGFEYTVDKRKAVMTSARVNGEERLSSPMEWTIWRAPTDNDRKIKVQWKEDRFDHVSSRAVSSSAACDGDTATLAFSFRLLPMSRQAVISGEVLMSINGKGEMLLSVRAERDMSFTFLPRFGALFHLVSDGSESCTYYGYGPYESYVDKHRASWIDLFEAKVRDMHEDYIVPQENGSHYGVSELSVGPVFAWSGQPFSFNASYYTAKELERAAHNYELVPSGSLELHLDYRQSGIGSGSCGPQLMDRYQLSEKHIDWDIVISFR